MSIFKFLGSSLLGGLGLGAFGTQKGRDFLFGSDKFKDHAAFTPAQQNIFGGITDTLQNSGGYNQAFQNLISMLDPSNEGYDRFTQPYMQQFNDEIIPGIAERFAGRGALSSSGFGQSLSSAAGGLQGNLAALKAQLQQQAGQSIFGQYQNALGQKPNYTALMQNQGIAGPMALQASNKFFGGGM